MFNKNLRIVALATVSVLALSVSAFASFTPQGEDAQLSPSPVPINVTATEQHVVEPIEEKSQENNIADHVKDKTAMLPDDIIRYEIMGYFSNTYARGNVLKEKASQEKVEAMRLGLSLIINKRESYDEFHEKASLSELRKLRNMYQVVDEQRGVSIAEKVILYPGANYDDYKSLRAAYRVNNSHTDLKRRQLLEQAHARFNTSETFTQLIMEYGGRNGGFKRDMPKQLKLTNRYLATSNEDDRSFDACRLAMGMLLDCNFKTRATELFEYTTKRFADPEQINSITQEWVDSGGGELPSPAATS